MPDIVPLHPGELQGHIAVPVHQLRLLLRQQQGEAPPPEHILAEALPPDDGAARGGQQGAVRLQPGDAAEGQPVLVAGGGAVHRGPHLHIPDIGGEQVVVLEIAVGLFPVEQPQHPIRQVQLVRLGPREIGDAAPDLQIVINLLNACGHLGPGSLEHTQGQGKRQGRQHHHQAQAGALAHLLEKIGRHRRSSFRLLFIPPCGCPGWR